MQNTSAICNSCGILVVPTTPTLGVRATARHMNEAPGDAGGSSANLSTAIPSDRPAESGIAVPYGPRAEELMPSMADPQPNTPSRFGEGPAPALDAAEPPYNVDAERAVLGACMHNGDIIDAVRPVLGERAEERRVGRDARRGRASY